MKIDSCAFSMQPMRRRHWRISTNHREGNSKEGFSKHFQNYLVSNFREANKKLIGYRVVKSF